MEGALKQKRFYEIDLLRFIAALSVVIFHYGFRGYATDDMTVMPYLSLAPLAKYGYLGVQAFFMISGFVILVSASSGGARRFIVSRTVRLYPAFWVCCSVTFIVTIIAGGERYSASLHQYAINMSMLNNYFDIESIDNAYWSLFVELKFYLLVMVVLLLRQTHRAKELLGLWLAAVLFQHLGQVGFVEKYLIPEYAPYFIAGAMFYIIHSEGFSAYNVFIILVNYLLMAKRAYDSAIPIGIFYNTPFNGLVIASLLTVIFIILFLSTTGCMKPFVSKKWLFFGALTYPLYLIHQQVGYIIFNMLYPLLNPHLIMLGTLATIILFAFLVNKHIEKRFSRPLKILLERLFALHSAGRTEASIHETPAII